MINLPQKLQGHIDTTQWETVSEGESGAQVYRLHDETTRYLKVSPVTAYPSIKENCLRLQWLESKIPVPQVLQYEESDTHQYLLMSDCPGLHPLHDNLNWTVEERIALLADASRAFHAIPQLDCPYRMSFNEQIARAQYNIEYHLIDETLLRGRNAEEIMAEIISLKPDAEDFVLTHGDMYPVNMRVDADSHTITGFIDVGAMAIADRYTDLAPIVNAIGWHHDKKWIARFFDLYGTPLDEKKLRFYQALHSFL